MAYTTINKSTDHFNTKLYTGNGSTQSITGVGFQPDWTWIKERGSSNNHELYDAVRGATKRIFSDANNAEDTNSTGLTAFGTDGFTLGGAGGTNNNSDTYVAWNWKAGNSAGSSNTDGSVTTTVSVNTTAGFSIVKYTGNGSDGATFGHGLGAIPSVVLIKQYDATRDWYMKHKGLSSGYNIALNGQIAQFNASSYNAGIIDNLDNTNTWSITKTSGVDPTNNNGNGGNYIAYCFAEKQGYSKFGSYSGNGSTDGPFVYTGFKPAFIMIKRTDSTAYWLIKDNKRPTVQNPVTSLLYPNRNDAEATGVNHADFLSNGYKIRTTGTYENASGGTYIYMAFAEAPLVGSNNVPATAR